ncbi:MAG: tRNA (adenosine(37)-N6)-threonylcarbamoyltransferase complex ATPase subunit type 1 TsaE [Parvularculaceae bacterium]
MIRTAPIARLSIPTPEAMATLGAAIASLLQRRDVIRLEGELGAGKSTLARGLIQHLVGADTEVPSPTYSLVQTYTPDPPHPPLWHFDLYRVKNADELWELGIEEAFDEGISLIEWPDKASSLLPQDALIITIEMTNKARLVHFFVEGAGWHLRTNAMIAALKDFNQDTPKGPIISTSDQIQPPPVDRAHTDREKQATAFLTQAGWQAATSAPVPGDASTRAYTRLTLGTKKAILMDAPPSAETASCPPEASPATRKDLGYNALARLAGRNLDAFVGIAAALRGAGLAAPEVLAHDTPQGFALLEDLGDGLIAHEIKRGVDEEMLYTLAIDALIRLRRKIISPNLINDYQVLSYDETAMLAECELLPEWYLPFSTGEECSADAMAEYETAWRSVLTGLSKPHALTLRDYHAENLLWRPEQTGQARLGIIDFQDALFGHGAYDLVSLLEDARRDVSPVMQGTMIRYYLAQAKVALPDFDADQFTRDYAILAAQRNAKIVGIFARLVTRDKKVQYSKLLPRIIAIFQNDIARPGLDPVYDWLSKYAPSLVGDQ